MAGKITSLSAGYAIRAVIAEALGDDVTAVYPVVSDKNAKMPFAVYYRTGVTRNPDKSNNVNDTCVITVEVFTTTYGEGVRLMERVRRALENTTIHYRDEDDADMRLNVYCSYITDCDEDYVEDAFKQSITIECKIC